MVIQIFTCEVKEGMMEKAIEIIKELVSKVREAEPGCIQYVAHTVKGRKNENTIIFYENYEDYKALRAHLKNVRTMLAKLLPLCEPGLDTKTCFEII